MPTKQELFDKMVRGLAAQNWEQSVESESIGQPACMYRQGCKKCAIGHLLTHLKEDDEIWHAQGDVVTILQIRPDALGFELEEGMLDFLKQAQSAHDTNSHGMKSRFQVLAQDFGLTFPSDLE